jgi:hypothetical protein
MEPQLAGVIFFNRATGVVTASQNSKYCCAK